MKKIYTMLYCIAIIALVLTACGGGGGSNSGSNTGSNTETDTRIASVKAIVNGSKSFPLKSMSRMDIDTSIVRAPGISSDYTAQIDSDGVLLEIVGPSNTKYVYSYPSEDVMEKRYYESEVLKTVTIFHYNQPTFKEDNSLDTSQKSDWVRVYNFEPSRVDGVVTSNAGLKYRINYNRPFGTWLVNIIQVYKKDTDHNDTDPNEGDYIYLSAEQKKYEYYGDNSIKSIEYRDGSVIGNPAFVATLQTFSTPIDIEEGTKIVEVVLDRTSGTEMYTINEYVTANTVAEELLSTVEDGEPSIDAPNIITTEDVVTIEEKIPTTDAPIETVYEYEYVTGTDDTGNWFNSFKKELNPFE